MFAPPLVDAFSILAVSGVCVVFLAAAVLQGFKKNRCRSAIYALASLASLVATWGIAHRTTQRPPSHQIAAFMILVAVAFAAIIITRRLVAFWERKLQQDPDEVVRLWNRSQ